MDMLIGSVTIRVDTATDTLRLLADFAIDDLAITNTSMRIYGH
tara:strand:+ start:56 stop:184 length:129 start_codon:yes stop_codon:yes gene_type:complete